MLYEVITDTFERRFDWLSELLARLQDDHILVLRGSATELAPAHILEIDLEDWARAARVAAPFGCSYNFV